MKEYLEWIMNITEACKVLEGDCLEHLNEVKDVHLTFLDPPYRQGKDYKFFDDDQSEERYWLWIEKILSKVHEVTVDGGSIYFMQREKNVRWMMKVLEETGWIFQNLIIWKKHTSPIPCGFRFGKQHQSIIFATRGRKPGIFNRLRIDYPLMPWHKKERKDGVYVPDVWDDIKELTAGYLAGKEALRDEKGNRIHKQQSPVALLLRIILSSTRPGDLVLDPLAGTGTTLITARQLRRRSIGIEIDPSYVKVIRDRFESIRPIDDVSRFHNHYRFTENLDEIWPTEESG